MTRRDFLGTAAAAPAAAQVQTTETGFTSLFDGQSLRGWDILDGPESAFYVKDGAIVVHEGTGFPCWLRSERQYENFDFRGQYFIKGWMDSGIYLHAPEHGRPIWNGMQFHIFHNNAEQPQVSSNGAILPVAPPIKINVRNKEEWNDFRILMDWPRFQAWTNGELVQDIDLEKHPELRYRLRRGFLGLMSLSYPIRFRNLQIRELPDKEQWQVLYGGPSDFDKWTLTQGGKAKFEPLGRVLHCDGNGSFATVEKFKDFELRLYVRHDFQHNSGVLFRTGGDGLKSKHYYEIQLHDVEGSHYPTGSLYHHKRATYPRIEAYQWWPMHLIVKGPYCMVRINGETVMEYEKLEVLEEGPIELQAHAPGRWTEFKDVRVKRL